MTDKEFFEKYRIPTMINWSGHTTTYEEFAFWRECNNFSLDDERARVRGHNVWSRSHRLENGSLLFLIEISQGMLPHVYYDVTIHHFPNAGEGLSLSNAYENVNLSMAVAVNTWNLKVWQVGTVTGTPLIPAHWMTPTVNFEGKDD